MTPKQFLEEECKNVERTLKETLRHDYGLAHTKDYYEECASRLAVLQGYVSAVAEADLVNIHLLCRQFSRLSQLISRIERSHLGEFSWPFANELRRLAEALFSEPGRAAPAKLKPPPIIHIFSDGGLSSYRINPEGKKAAIHTMRRIITIVFPRTLKHHVLFHSIFGHEIGHAAWEIDILQVRLLAEVIAPLRSKGPMKGAKAADDWLNDVHAPPELISLRQSYKVDYGEDPNITTEQLDSWLQEFMCDLFGLVTFGPSFLAAHRALLNGLDPIGYLWGEDHPPYECRRQMLLRACEYLGWTSYAVPDAEMNGPLRSFWNDYGTIASPVPWAAVFDDAQIQKAVDGLKAILTDRGFPLYALPNPADFAKLLRDAREGVPPAIGGFDAAGKVFNTEVDFRDILFAGWVAWAGRQSFKSPSGEAMPFLIINRLCDHAIMQQQAVRISASTGTP